jgi:TolB-like protein/predicted Zn-dependent protease
MNLRSFFTELRRRNVYKVAVAYAVVAWLLIQAASILFPTFEAPAWVMKVFIAAIALGFPIALILAWAFALTPEGIKRTGEVEPVRSRGRTWIYIAIVAAALSIALFFLGRFTAPAKTAASADISSKSIAVLPFENLSEEKANAYFASGIQDEILTRLTRIGALKVISRTSTAHYASSPHNLPEIAKELGVANILEGSVQKAGEAVHINVQLVRAATDEHLWAESYDRDLKNIFGVEREIAETIAGQLKAQLLPEEAKELARVPTTNPQAYDLYLRAKYVVEQVWNAEADSLKPALELYRKAIELDPDFALAYAELARAEGRMYLGGEDRSPERLADADANIEKSLALQPDLVLGHLMRASFLLEKRDWSAAMTELELVQKRWPNDPQGILSMARAKGGLGDWQAELAGFLRALELDPRNSTWHRWLAGLYASLRRYDDAAKYYAKAIALAPDDWIAHVNRADTWIDQGDLAQARAELMTWPDAKLMKTALWLKYSDLELIETYSRNYDAALEAGQKIPDMGNRIPTGTFPVGNIQKNIDIGFVRFFKGDEAGARAAFTAARTALEPQRAAHADDPYFYDAAAFIAAGLGERDAAIEAANKTIALVPMEKDVHEGARRLFTLAQIYGHFGDADKAIPLLEKLFAMPTTGHFATPALLRMDPIWDPIRHDPRFQKLCQEKQL